MRGMCAAVLALEAIVMALAVPVLITVEDVPAALACAYGLGLALLAVVTAGLLRFEWAYLLGWLVQVLAVAMGFWMTAAFLIGGIFAVLWTTAVVLGRRIEHDRAANPGYYAS